MMKILNILTLRLGQCPEDGEVHHEQSEDHAEGSGQGLDHSSGAHSLLLAKQVW